MNTLLYKDYVGSVHYSDEDEVFYGKVMHIKSLLNYEGIDVHSIKKAFQEAVDDYLQHCEDNKIIPEKPFKGSFNVRVGEDVHREIVTYAEQHNLSLNQLVKNALLNYLTHY